MLTTRALLEANALTASSCLSHTHSLSPFLFLSQADLISKAIYSYENKRHIRKTTSTAQSRGEESRAGTATTKRTRRRETSANEVSTLEDT